MKILHVIPSISLRHGGPSIAVQNTARALAATGVDITIATTNDDGPSKLNVLTGVPIKQDGYTVFYFDRTLSEYTMSLSIAPWLLLNMYKYDLVHIHAVFSYTSTVAGIIANLLGIPYIVRPAGILQSWGVQARRKSFKQLHYWLFERWILNRAEFVQAMTTAEALEYEALSLKTPIYIIPHGLDDTCKPDSSVTINLPLLEDNALPYLFLGRFHQVKGIDLLLPAFAEALRQECRLVLFLAGDGDEAYKAWMRETIQTLGIGSRVHWLGFLNAESKQAVIAASTAVIVPSYTENFGMVVAESIMCGTPVIVSNRVGLAVEIDAAEAGIVVSCEVNSIAQAILTIANNDELRARMSKNARSLALEKFRLSKVTTELMRNYDKYRNTHL